MKNLIITLIMLTAFGISLSPAQDLRFSYTSTLTGTTSEIKVFVSNSGPVVENLAGFTVNFYYDNAESILTGFDTSPAAALGWDINAPSNTFLANVNPAVTITHTGYGTINVIDQNVQGTDIDGSGPVHILTIILDHTGGTPAASQTWLASSADNHPALQYSGNDFFGHPVIATSFPTSLPVEFLGFEAKALENRATLLTWITGSELNNKGFEIERADGGSSTLSWETIGFVDGEGTTSSKTEYAFVDPTSYRGENLYRLRQVDFDGAFEYSDIRSVRFEGPDGLSVYPNPTSDILHVEFGETLQLGDSAAYYLLDQRGRAIGSGELNPMMVSQISLSDLPEGVYILKVVQQGRTMEKRVVKVD